MSKSPLLHFSHPETRYASLALLGFILSAGFLMTAAASFLHRQMLRSHEEMAQTVVQTATDIVQEYSQHVANGTLTLSQGQTEARRALRLLRYGNGNYVFIASTDGTIIMHPLQPETEGKSVLETHDSHGTYFYRDIISSVATTGEGTIRYWWPKPGSRQEAEKITYVKLYTPWNWVIGTGTFLEDESTVTLIGCFTQIIIASILFAVSFSLTHGWSPSLYFPSKRVI